MADIAVFTGDVVRSSKLPQDALEALFGALADGVRQAGEWPDCRLSVLERFRGDGWQLIIDRPAFALRLALVLHAHVRARDDRFACRMAIARGEAASVDLEAPGRSRGAPFEAAGAQVDSPGGTSLFRVAGVPGDTPLQLAPALFGLAGTIAGGWTSARARIMTQMLDAAPPTQATLARLLGITPQAVGEHWRLGGGPALLDAVRAWEGVSA